MCNEKGSVSFFLITGKEVNLPLSWEMLRGTLCWQLESQTLTSGIDLNLNKRITSEFNLDPEKL